MNYKNKPINFSDNRGEIRDILIGESVDAITLITFTPGSVRGNHYHKESYQYSYVISGKLICATQVGDGEIETKEITGGDLVFHPAGEKHAFKALEHSVFLSMTSGPRKGEDYEKDIYRLDNPLLS